jgi:hypothetical protein
MYAALIAVAATIVALPGSPLGLLTEGVQVLAGVLLPSLTVFLLLLCNDAEVLGPWVNGRAKNVFAGVVVGVLVLLSVILTLSVVFGSVSLGQIVTIVAASAGAAALTGVFLLVRRMRSQAGQARASVPAARKPAAIDRSGKENWRMPPLAMLAPARMSLARRVGMAAMWLYLGLAFGAVILRVVEMASGG